MLNTITTIVNAKPTVWKLQKLADQSYCSITIDLTIINVTQSMSTTHMFTAFMIHVVIVVMTHIVITSKTHALIAITTYTFMTILTNMVTKIMTQTPIGKYCKFQSSTYVQFSGFST